MVRAVTRRRMLRASAAASLGLGGAVVLAACGETQVVTREVPVERVVVKEVPVETVVTKTEIKEVPVERVVTQTQVQVKEVEVEKVVEKVVEVERVVEKVVEKVVEVQAQRPPVNLVFVNDHSSGPRGAALKWALDRFRQESPHINARYTPQPDAYATAFGVQIAAGTQAEVALLSGWFASRWHQAGAFAQIDDVVRKRADWNPRDYYFDPDTSSVVIQDTLPIGHLDGIRGPMFGMPYQGNCTGTIINLDMLEGAGIEFPTEGKWGIETELLDAIKQATDPEAGSWGLLASGGWFGPRTDWGWALANDPNLTYRSDDHMRTTMWDSGAVRGIEFMTEAIHTHGVAPPLTDTKELAGEFGDAFSAGRVMIRAATSLGTFINRIKDRFKFSRLPQAEGPRGPAPHVMSTQPHLVTSSVHTRGNIEESVELVMFMAGRDVQGRIGIDRGSVPIRPDVLTSPEYAAGPPENHSMMKDFFDQPDMRSAQMGTPFWREWQSGGSPAVKNPAVILLGEVSVEEGTRQVLESADAILQDNIEEWYAFREWQQGLPNPIGA